MSFVLRTRPIYNVFKPIAQCSNTKFTDKVISPDIKHTRSYTQNVDKSTFVDYNTEMKSSRLSTFIADDKSFCVTADDSPEDLNMSGYPIYAACLAPFIHSKHWYAETTPKAEKEDPEAGSQGDSNMAEFLKKFNQTSLEQIRKMLLDKNQSYIERKEIQ